MKNHLQSKGFTLVEAGVVFIIAVVILIPLLTLITSSLGTFNDVKNSILATNLAQESLEIIINLRDQAFLSSLVNQNNPIAFDQYFKACEAGVCCANYDTQAPPGAFNCSSNTQVYLDNDKTTGNKVYVNWSSQHSGSNLTPTLFNRYLTAVPLPANNPTKVFIKSTVTWPNNQVNIYEELYDWRPRTK